MIDGFTKVFTKQFALLCVIPLLFILACENSQSSSEKSENIVRQAYLKNFIVELLIQNYESPKTNQSVEQWTQSFASSTNDAAVKIRKDIDELWISEDPSDWTIQTNRPVGTSKALLAAKYRINSKTFLVEIDSASTDKVRSITNFPPAGLFQLNLK